VNTVGTQNTSGNAATATALETARTIGGESFDGTANIDLPGVNTAGTQNTSGNAATAAALQTARTIALTGDVTGSATFDGSGNVSISTTSSEGGVWTSSGTSIYYNSGNVGIGTVSPSAHLHVSSGTSGDCVLKLEADTDNDTETDNARIEFISDGGYNTAVVGAGQMPFSNENLNALVLGAYQTIFYTGVQDFTSNSMVERMRIADTGNVGIGTASPNRQLQIYGNSSNFFSFSPAEADDTNIVDYTNFGATSFKKQMTMRLNNRNWYWGIVNDTSNYLGLAMDGGGSPDPDIQCVFQNDGTFFTKYLRVKENVGIGTTNPDLELHVHDANNSTSGIILSSTSGYHRFYEASGQLYFQSGTAASADSRADINFTSMYASTTYMKILGSNGNVGIGTATPYAKLHVNGTGNVNIGASERQYFRHGYGGGFGSTPTSSGYGWGNSSIYASHSIVSGDFFMSISGAINSSDVRIKKNIVDADDAECLEVLRLLKPKKYQYKDEIKSGTEPVWGFIAQEVRETLPYATKTRQFVLPNIYELANVSQSNVITFTNFNTSNLESNATTLIRTKGIDGEDHDIHLAEVIDAHSIRVEEDLTEWTGSVDETGNVVAGNQLFVYGQEVDDFVFLKKEAIWTVATAALQEVDRQLQAEKAKVATLDTQLTSVLARLAALENA
jgi:hypothetical protein